MLNIYNMQSVYTIVNTYGGNLCETAYGEKTGRPKRCPLSGRAVFRSGLLTCSVF